MAGTIRNKDLNLLAALNRGKKKKKIDKKTLPIILLAVVICAATALFLMYSLDRTNEISSRLDAALSYVSDPAIKAQYDESLQNQSDAATVKAQADSLVSAVSAIDSYPDLTEDDFKQLFNLAGKTVAMMGISYDRQTGVLSFSAKCGDSARVPVFIGALRSSGIFSSVSYEGYAGGTYSVPGKPKKNSDGEVVATQKTATEYTFNVNCVANTNAERSNEQ